MKIIYQLIFLLPLSTTTTASPVTLKITTNPIIFNKTTNLECTLDDSLDITNGRSRQWSGGVDNKVLSFNGFPSDPNKYKERVVSNRKFILSIFNMDITDVNCYYKCVYGFKFDEKMLDLNTVPYKYIPKSDELETSENNGVYSLMIKKIYPFPNCSAVTTTNKPNLFIKGKENIQQIGLFYNNVKLTYDFTSQGEIMCKISCYLDGTQTPMTIYDNTKNCTKMSDDMRNLEEETSSNTLTNTVIIMAGIIGGVVVTVITALLITKVRRHMHSGKDAQDQTHNSSPLLFH